MSKFKPELIDLKPGDLVGADVDFYLYEMYPVIYVNDSSRGEMGGIALFGRIRTFPLNELYSYNASPLSKAEFFDRFPELTIYFTQPEKQAA